MKSFRAPILPLCLSRRGATAREILNDAPSHLGALLDGRRRGAARRVTETRVLSCSTRLLALERSSSIVFVVVGEVYTTELNFVSRIMSARGRDNEVSSTKSARARDEVANALRDATKSRTANDGRGRRKKFAADRGEKAPAAERERTIPKGEPCDAIPMDWTVKSSVRFTSDSSFHWCSCLGAVPVSEGLRAYSGGSATQSDVDAVLYNKDDLASAQRALTRASYSCAYPADVLPSEALVTMRSSESGRAWLERRQSTWSDALVSLYGLLRVRQCYAFYVIYEERTILFCAPGVGGVNDGGYAVVTNSNIKIRRALNDAGVDFVSADEEAAAIENAQKLKKQVWRPEDEQRTLLDDLAGDEVSRANVKHPMESAEATTMLANMDKPSGARRRAADTIICRGAIAVSGLLNVLMEASGGDLGSSDFETRDVPTLLSPVPFAHSSMKPLTLTVQMNTTTRKEAKDASSLLSLASGNVSTRSVYTAETPRNEFVPPWALARMCAVLAAKQGDIRVLCSIVPQTHGLNVGVLAAYDIAERNASHTEDVLIRECAYYDEVETSRIMAPPPLGSSAINKIEYMDGMYYV